MNGKATTVIPDELAPYLADSMLRVESWQAADGILSLHVQKEIGLESGRIVLGGVSRVCLPPLLEVERIESAQTVPSEDANLEAGEFVLVIHGVSWTQPFYVVATSIDYVVLARQA